MFDLTRNGLKRRLEKENNSNNFPESVNLSDELPSSSTKNIIDESCFADFNEHHIDEETLTINDNLQPTVKVSHDHFLQSLSLQEFLKKWCVEFFIQRNAVTALLHKLKEFFPEFRGADTDPPLH